MTVNRSLGEWAQGDFTYKNERFFYKDEELPSNLNRKIVQMATEGQDPTALLRFHERLSKNPSFRSVQQLFQFLDHGNIPFTKDGCFLAYKSVRGDYKDKHSGLWDNRPGAVNEMPRNQISDDPQHACHEGFHVGALNYARGFGGSKMVVCKVDPEHVVCVPYDASQEKMRVCKYKVIGEWSGQPLDSLLHDEEGLVEPKVKEKRTPPLKEKQDEVKVKKKAVSGGFKKYDKMTTAELMTCSLDELRQYAGKGLEIVGASKIPGGKVALVASIEKVRK